MINQGLTGSWIVLEPVNSANRIEAEAIELTRQRTPNLGGRSFRAPTTGVFGPPMLVRDARTGTAVGVIEAGQLSGYAGVAVLLVFLDQSVARPGFLFEVFGLFVGHLFERGARLVHFEVLATNAPILRMARTLGLEPQARLREHLYAGGRLYDAVVYAFDRVKWQAIRSRYASMLPGGGRRPSALGGRRSSARG
jgi:hypothetical protein